MVINIGALKDGDDELVEHDITCRCRSCKRKGNNKSHY